MDIYEIASHFVLDGKIISAREFGSGHINRTYTVECENKKYVIQKINTNVFKDVDALMNNVFSVTDYLKSVIKAQGGDYERETLNFVKTRDGNKYFLTDDGESYRAYVFVEDSVCYDYADSAEQFGKSGEAFGTFQKMLADFPAGELSVTIPNFHNTHHRYENEFLKSIVNAGGDLISLCENEIEFIKNREGEMSKITDLIEDGEIPVRVTHNDTKLNNILFDKETGQSLAVIDLDTVMPGSALYDFGDSIRFGASTAAEDEDNLDKVELNLEYFKAYSKGFLNRAGDVLTDAEWNNLAFSAKLMTLECGMRFLTDFLNGNVYFKIDYPEHNLVRARNQLKLVSDMEGKAEKMNSIINEIRSHKS